ncbi:uncharacterized protein RCC_08033 [Ramularia collo-cygni]|uniref:Uncharacterized protein n=1 Tax=Ramularia collo-cygni TaxID=112498 RepID=A0A2D3VGW0_9PEZI|nr:uncharacterized protein RCC_08033 [Ramularia collo-cygni]CZT22164.1 uncharacterized protein RCC_08033 [Ramularia collo-cygni]
MACQTCDDMEQEHAALVRLLLEKDEELRRSQGEVVHLDRLLERERLISAGMAVTLAEAEAENDLLAREVAALHAAAAAAANTTTTTNNNP